MPRPPCLLRLIWFSAMMPKITLSRTPPRIPKINEAIAKPLVDGFGGYGAGACPYWPYG